MAEAFRKALRKPEFPSDPSPGTTNSNGGKSSSNILDPTIGGGGEGHGNYSPSGQNLSVGGDPSGSGSGGGFFSSGMGLGGLAALMGGGDRGQGMDEDEGQSLMAKELQSEGRSMRSNTERRKPEVMSSDDGEE
jgi:hypothetical protein